MFVKKLTVYGFPLFLIGLEAILRAALQLDSLAFTGPTLAAGGVALVVPIILPKRRDYGLSTATEVELESKGITFVSSAEQLLADVAVFAILLLTGAWMLSLYLSCKLPSREVMGVPLFLLVGITCYFIGIVMSELKRLV